MNKQEIRLKVKTQKSLLNAQEVADAAARVFDMLENTAAFLMADNILMYHSLPDELSTHSFLNRWASRKHFFLPRVNGVNLDILPYERTSLHLGSFHIEEPDGDDITPVEEIEVVVVPAVAYDRKGNRVGRGKGYYDRLLQETKAVKIGVGYDFQLIDNDYIDVEDFDVPVDIVITPSRIIYTRHSRR